MLPAAGPFPHAPPRPLQPARRQSPVPAPGPFADERGGATARAAGRIVCMFAKTRPSAPLPRPHDALGTAPPRTRPGRWARFSTRGAAGALRLRQALGNKDGLRCPGNGGPRGDAGRGPAVAKTPLPRRSEPAAARSTGGGGGRGLLGAAGQRVPPRAAQEGAPTAEQPKRAVISFVSFSFLSL